MLLEDADGLLADVVVEALQVVATAAGLALVALVVVVGYVDRRVDVEAFDLVLVDRLPGLDDDAPLGA